MHLGIEGKVALVSGSSSGLGAAIADRFSQEGCRVVLFARSRDKLELLAEDLRSRYNAEILSVAGDMCEANAIKQLLTKTTE